MLADARPDLRIGYFAHTPFCSAEGIGVLPDDVARGAVPVHGGPPERVPHHPVGAGLRVGGARDPRCRRRASLPRSRRRSVRTPTPSPRWPPRPRCTRPAPSSTTSSATASWCSAATASTSPRTSSAGSTPTTRFLGTHPEWHERGRLRGHAHQLPRDGARVHRLRQGRRGGRRPAERALGDGVVAAARRRHPRRLRAVRRRLPSLRRAVRQSRQGRPQPRRQGRPARERAQRRALPLAGSRRVRRARARRARLRTRSTSTRTPLALHTALTMGDDERRERADALRTASAACTPETWLRDLISHAR